MLRVSVKASALPTQIRRIGAAVATGWWQAYSRTAEGLIEREQARHFASQAAPDGTAWAPLSKLTLELAEGAAAAKVGGRANAVFEPNRKKVSAVVLIEGFQGTATVRRTKDSKILQDTGHLRASVTSNAADAVRERAQNSLIVGTRVGYAVDLQMGATIDVTPALAAHMSNLLGRPFKASVLRIPARPFLGTGTQVRHELATAAADATNRAVRQAAGGGAK